MKKVYMYNDFFKVDNKVYKECCIDLFCKEKYKIRISINKPLRIICLDIVTENDKESILTSFEKTYKKYNHILDLCKYCKERIKSAKSTYDLTVFLKEFGLSFHYDYWIKLYTEVENETRNN